MLIFLRAMKGSFSFQDVQDLSPAEFMEYWDILEDILEKENRSIKNAV